jgi:replicative DNA helicase
MATATKPQSHAPAAHYITPPHNLESEKAVLGTFFLNQDAVADVRGILSPEDFYDPRHRLIYETICRISERNEPIDPLIVINILSSSGSLEKVGGADYLAALEQSVLSPGNVLYHAEIVREKALHRSLIKFAQEAVEKSFSEQSEARVLVTDLMTSLFSIVNKSNSGGFRAVSTTIPEVYNEMMERIDSQEEFPGIPTGLKSLDRTLLGLQRGELSIVGARPSAGKTTFGLNVALGAAMRGFGVGIFSVEMKKEHLIAKLTAKVSNVNSRLFRTPKQLTERQIQDIQQAFHYVSDLPIWIDDTSGLNITDARLRAQQLKRMFPKIDLFLIDYLQLMRGGVNKKFRDSNRNLEVGEISQGLKELSKELNIHVMALAQLSRNIEQRPSPEPQLSDLRESGNIEQDADTIMFLFNPKSPKGQPENKSCRENNFRTFTTVKIAKQRNGEVGMVPMLYDRPYQKFVDVAERDEEPYRAPPTPYRDD